MNPLLKTHTRQQIATITGKSYRTILNWLQNDTTPLWALKKLGFDIIHKEEPNNPDELRKAFFDDINSFLAKQYKDMGLTDD